MEPKKTNQDAIVAREVPPKRIANNRRDGWANLWTGVGMLNVDKRTKTAFQARKRLDDDTLRSIYRENGIGKRIIEVPTLAMTRAGFEVVGDPDKMVQARFEETGINASIKNLIRWSKLFGGALGVIGADDGQKYDQPLDLRRLRNVTHLHVFPRPRVTFTTADLYSDPANPKFGQPQFYRIAPLSGRVFVVHESRTVRMDGRPVDDITRWQNWGWGDPVYQSCFEKLRQIGAVFDSAEFIVEDFVHGVYSITGMNDMIAEGREKEILTRLDIMAKTTHVSNDKLIDKDLEGYTKVASSVAGLSDLLDRFMASLSADADGIPVTLLFGKSAAGLNATGEGDERNFYDQVAAEQEEYLRPVLERLCELIFLSQDGYFDGQEPENWWIEFNALRQMTDKERADICKIQADERVAYVTAGILSEDEVRNLPDLQKEYGLEPGSAAPLDADDVQAEEPMTAPDMPLNEDVDGQEGVRNAQVLYAGRAQLVDARGRRRADASKFVAQTLVLSKKQFPSEAAARAWVKKHGFVAPKVDVTQSTFRFRQEDPAKFAKGSFRTITPAPGIEIVLGRLNG